MVTYDMRLGYDDDEYAAGILQQRILPRSSSQNASALVRSCTGSLIPSGPFSARSRSLLNSQSLGRELRFTTENFSQTAAVATSSASTLTAPPPPPPPVPPATSNRRIMLGLLAAIVAVLFGTSTYCMHLRGKNRAWEVRACARV